MQNGKLYPNSACASEYSVLSLLVFTLVFFSLLLVMLYLLLRRVTIHIPPARHCSTVISAACHPPTDDVDAHLNKVSWGVTEERVEDEIGHCTFTSRYVTGPQTGFLYQ